MLDPKYSAGRMIRSFDMHDVDVAKFMEALDNTKGNVFLVTDEGDRFNLKSKLSQMAGLLHLIEGGKLVKARIEAEDPEDESYLFRINLFGDYEKRSSGSDEDGKSGKADK